MSGKLAGTWAGHPMRPPAGVAVLSDQVPEGSVASKQHNLAFPAVDVSFVLSIVGM